MPVRHPTARPDTPRRPRAPRTARSTRGPLRTVAAGAVVAVMPLVGAGALPVSALSPVVVPAAQAAPAAGGAECRPVTRGTVGWGIRQSFRRYLTGPVAGGSWTLDGVGFRGEPAGSDGAFTFTAEPGEARVEGDDADIPLAGTLTMDGHLGLLHIRLSALELQVRGTTARLVADGDYRGLNPVALSGSGGPGSFRHTPIATVALDGTLGEAGAADGTAHLTGRTWITPELNAALGGQYGEGDNEGDPLDLTLATGGPVTDGDCGLDATTATADDPGRDAAGERVAPQPGGGAASVDTAGGDTAPAAGPAPAPAAAPAPAPAAPAAAPAAAAGPAETCRAVTSASVGWGVKQSFRRYLTGPIAGGHWDLDGVGFSGDRGGRGTFDFTGDTAAATVSGGDADIPLRGAVTFTGHAGLLTIRLSALSLRIRGTQAQIVADYRTNTVSSFRPGADVTGADTGTQRPIASFTLDRPLDATAGGTVTLTGTGVLTDDGNTAFGGTYGPGNNEADPISVTLGLGGAGCGDGATAGGAPTCDASTTRRVSESRIGWGVKDSFRSYIRGSVAKGSWTTDGAVENGGAFIFSGAEGAVDTSGPRGTVAARGSVTFTGHGGTLRTVVADPEVTFSGGTGTLTADVTSNDTQGTPHAYGRIAVADLTVTASVDGGVLDGTAEATLTQAGANALSDFYEPGTVMSPVSVRAALAGAADCGALDGSGATGAGTAGSTPDVASLGALPTDGSSAPATGSGEVDIHDRPSGAAEDRPRSVAMALAQNPTTPVALAVLVVAAGVGLALGLRGRRRAGDGADTGPDPTGPAR
ncbi:HtaA domain-containing protein [Corynebacterium bovis]|uniref:HtaA domain-containing protein n=1 Tax=Corynebacterium bovis TaxID=36808 RepID=UPI00313960F1